MIQSPAMTRRALMSCLALVAACDADAPASDASDASDTRDTSVAPDTTVADSVAPETIGPTGISVGPRACNAAARCRPSSYVRRTRQYGIPASFARSSRFGPSRASKNSGPVGNTRATVSPFCKPAF